MTNNSDVYFWTGEHTFSLNASGLKEDTLRIRPQPAKSEALFQLRLPTLCITYADMEFQNKIGGLQENYPTSRAYGPAYFDPPVEIVGQQEIERLTYIRGAQRVEIRSKETLVEFPSWKELVIPRLRIEEKQTAHALLSAKDVSVFVEEPVSLKVMQFADGRHIGGIDIEVRHPEYVEPELVKDYTLELRVIDAIKLEPLPEVCVNIWRWHPEMVEGEGWFQMDDQVWTGGDGGFVRLDPTAGELHVVNAYLPGWRITPRCYRPLPGELVRLHLRAWPLSPSKIRYPWKNEDRLEAIALRCGVQGTDILQMNGLRDPAALARGMTIQLPCYAGAQWLDPWDTPQKLVQRYRFEDEKMLARINGLRSLQDYDGSLEMQLPGWHFFHAGEKDTLETFDAFLGLPDGSCVPAGRVYRPNAIQLFMGELVGVPTHRIAR